MIGVCGGYGIKQATALVSFMLFGAVDNEAAAVLFFLGLAFTGLGQYVLGVALKVKERKMWFTALIFFFLIK